VFKNKVITDEFIDLLKELLTYEPSKRIKPLEALAHPFFDELRDEKTKLPNGDKLPSLFNFTQEEISINPQLVEKLTPSWYIK
jgi:glycogen synthase kinase 3 beta